jgi:hypothetical protein
MKGNGDGYNHNHEAALGIFTHEWAFAGDLSS